MAILNETQDEYQISEGVVYRIRASVSNIRQSAHITGTGTVNLRGCVQIPTSINDPILTLDESDTDITGFKEFKKAMVNYIKFEENQTGTRIITLKGFVQPIPIEF